MTADRVRAIGIAAASVIAISAADPRPEFAVGVLRRDGIIIPFASYDGKRWQSKWPAPALDLIVPIDLRAVPSSWWGQKKPLEQWDVWVGESTTSRRVSVTQPDWVDVHCLRQIGLKTTYQSDKPAPPATVQPYPKDGLAVSPPQPVEPIEVLSPTAPEVQSLALELRTAFNQAERKTEEYGHPIERRAREGIAPDVEAAYAYGREPRYFYVEATRAYRKLGQPAGDCEALAFASGWFVREQGAIRSIGANLHQLRCDRYGSSYMLPLGVLRLGGKLFWLAQYSGWDFESFSIIELTPKNHAVAMAAFGGGGC